MKSELYLVLDNIRSIYNVGAIFRIADCVGVCKIYLTGITPYPTLTDDPRKPWELERIEKQLSKTALGAEKAVKWEYASQIETIIEKLTSQSIHVFALEISPDSTNIFETLFPKQIGLIVGNEINGINQKVLEKSTKAIHIPMVGMKESLNVSTATAIACYEWYRQVHFKNMP